MTTLIITRRDNLALASNMSSYRYAMSFLARVNAT
jgi:hypothetical protein